MFIKFLCSLLINISILNLPDFHKYLLSAKKKPEISLPTQFEHTVHVGFDPITGEFTVSYFLFLSSSIF